MDVRDWVDEVHLKIDQLGDLLAGEVELDFSPDSLPGLEQAVLDRGAEPIAEFYAAYLGELLLRVTGGGWAVVADQPVLRPDPALGLGELAPVELVRTAFDRRSGQEFQRVHQDWAEAARRHTRAHPDWLPDKEPTPGLDRSLPGPSSELDTWLARREREFPAWRERFGGEGEWDFSAASIEPLTAAVLRETPDLAAFQDSPEFVDGAAWYWGEVLRRSARSAWQHTPGERDGRSPTLGYFWLHRPDVGRRFTPELNLVLMLELGDPQRLHTLFDDWRS